MVCACGCFFSAKSDTVDLKKLLPQAFRIDLEFFRAVEVVSRYETCRTERPFGGIRIEETQVQGFLRLGNPVVCAEGLSVLLPEISVDRVRKEFLRIEDF